MAKAHTLVDNFNDNSTDTSKWHVNGPIEEVNGRVEARALAPASDAAYFSNAAYDLTDSWVHLEVVRTFTPAYGKHVFLHLWTAGAGYLRIGINAVVPDRLIFSDQLGGESVPYDPERHRWWRLRERSGTTYWETSPDGYDWEIQRSKPNPFDLTSVHIRFDALHEGGVHPSGLTIFDNFNALAPREPRRTDERRLSARDIRVEAAELAAARPHEEHANNNDEVRYPGNSFIGSYSKGLPHDALGDPDPVGYGTLLRALQSRSPADFEEIILGTIPSDAKRLKLTNPQAGLAFDVEGPDAQALTMPPAHRFDSEQTAHEMGELYWMAVARDVHFAAYTATTPPAEITAAVSSLNQEFPQFGGTTPVTGQNLFRGIYPGEQVGPYVSQFLLKGNADPRKLDGQGRDADEGFISYGARTIDQRLRPAAAGTDYLTSFATWLDVQNGVDKRGQDSFDAARRFIRNLRDGATFVHFDQVIDAFYNAAWLLMSEPVGTQWMAANATGRPQIDLEFPKDQGNPYDPPGTGSDSRTQAGFATFGPIHLLQVLSEVMGRALRAVWWQKWGVHRRLRPEEYGGRVHNHVTGARTYPLHTSIIESLTQPTTSDKPARLSTYFGQTGEKFPTSYLLPQAYPEGAPTHPAYGAGHATGSGALVTILKAFFDESKAIENPVVASADGLSLVAYTGADAGQMTVGGELNKLAGNVALFRNAAGVHWRSDYTESLPFGEAIAIRLLQEMSLGFNEDGAFFELTKFDGQKIRISEGEVVPVV